MNILLVGGSSRFLELLVDKLHKEGHRVFQLTEEPKTTKKLRKVFEVYRFPYDDACIREVADSIRPDVTVFFGAYDINFEWNRQQSRPQVFASAVFNLAMASADSRFLYLSSHEVCTEADAALVSCEETPRAHTQKGQALLAGESICQSYRRMGNDAVVLRLDHLYGPPENAAEARDVVSRMAIEGLETGEIQADATQQLMLLYYADAVEFLYQVITAKQIRHGLYQISSGETTAQADLAQLTADALGGVTVVPAPSKKKREPMLDNSRFSEEFGISIFHHPAQRVQGVAEQIKKHASDFIRTDARKKSLPLRLIGQLREFQRTLVPFVENLICFVPFFMLNNRTVGREYLQNIDVYLLYVLLFAIVYGQQQATFSCLLSIAGYVFRQMYTRSGYEVIADVNTYLWMAQLLILGLSVGYLRDRLHAVEDEEKHEVSYLSKQIDDISDINTSNVRVKELLSSQIINQNDSFGKLYEITSSLDQYEPSEVLFYAAEVLARLMGSKDAAIYSVANASYARLFSSTSRKARSLGNSINYRQMDEMYVPLSAHKVYINRSMDGRYPLMADALYSDDEMQLILMVWGIPWERMTLGQANMLTVIGYLIQNAVLRANRYMSALQYQRYLPDTNILEPEAFASLVTGYLHAREKGLTECALIEVDPGDTALSEAGTRLASQMRQSDFIGQTKNGSLYVLLANTNAGDAGMVADRFRQDGFSCQITEEVLP